MASVAGAHLAVGPDGLNLLGFLAGLGTLVALRRAWPDRTVRLSWTLPRRGLGAGGWRPLLHVQPSVSQEDIVDALYAQVTKAVSLTALGDVDDNLRISKAAFRSKAVSLQHDRTAADLLAALVAEAGAKDDLKPTPFRALTGAGHLKFLKTVRALSDPTRLRRVDIARALFQPWTYENIRLTFRWDPVDYRPFADRAYNPAEDLIRTEWGANRLAFEALVLFPMVWNGEVVGVRSNEVRWPIWLPPASVETIRSLLAHPVLFLDSRAAELERLGVRLVASCRRFTWGQQNAYVNFTSPRIAWSSATIWDNHEAVDADAESKADG